MFIHCKTYRYDIQRVLSAVFALLLVFLFARASTTGKPRIALLGDSMTWIGGDSCQNKTGWTHVLKESGLSASIDVYARSGATWTNTISTRRNPELYTELLHDDNVIYNQAIRIIESADTCDATPDLIVLFAGANDAWFKAKRPAIFDTPSPPNNVYNDSTSTQPHNYTTLVGSIGLVCDLLHNRFPNATLLFVSPLQMSRTDAETIFKVSDIIEKTASEKGWFTLRADKETGITHEQEVKSHTYTYDGVHTNPAGAKILGDYITQYIKSHLITDSLKLKTQ